MLDAADTDPVACASCSATDDGAAEASSSIDTAAIGPAYRARRLLVSPIS
jgi:hypothetical protein